MLSIPTILQIYHPEPLPFVMGKCIGEGNQGHIYEDGSDIQKVIKLSIIYDDFGKTSLDDRFEDILTTYKYVISNPHQSLMKAFSIEKLYKGSQPIFEWEQEYIIFYAILERLEALSENETKVFKTICDAFNKEIATERTIETILKELKDWFAVDDAKVLDFYNSLSGLKINNGDFQPRNIMKDKENNFKMIDYDLAKLKEKKDGENRTEN